MIHTLSLVPDCFSSVILVAIIICMRFDKSGYVDFQKNRLFQKCVYVSLLNVILHIPVLLILSNTDKISQPLTTALMTVSFIVSGILALLIYGYLILHLHSNSPSIYCRISLAIRYAMSAVYALIVLLSLKTGWVFSWGPDRSLLEGRLYEVCLILYVAHFLVMLVEFIIFNKRGPYSFYRLAFIAGFTCAGATVIQLIFPSGSLNATYGALAVFVIFISVQQNANEVDSLTSIYMRSMLNSLLDLTLKKREKFSILAIKIERFQQINMRFNPENGDNFLKQIAAYLRQIEPKHIYRMKGVTFALVFPDYSEADYQAKLSQIRERFTKPWRVNVTTETMIDASFADLVWDGKDHKNTNTILSNIEYALTVVRLDRSTNYLRFDQSMQEDYNRREHVIDRLKFAMDEDQAFRFCYQPIFALQEELRESYEAQSQRDIDPPFTGVGAEVLLRLNDTDGTPLSPAEFIPIAESTGQIVEITHMTLRMACDFLKKHSLPENWFITLNISAHQFIDKNFIHTVIRSLKDNNLNYRQIKLEITEYTSLVDEDVAIDHINLLGSHGIEVFLDDFGTGYSNLFAASHLPIGCVKIDRSLIQHIKFGTPAYGLLAAFISGFKKFDIESLTEGVEEQWQLKAIYEMGAAMAQGYYLSRPLEEEAFLAWIKNHRSSEALIHNV